jgi:hypothetical protein
MFEFNIHARKSSNFIREANSWDNVAAKRSKEAIRAKNAAAPKINYGVNFRDMHANLRNAKPGCRSCKGTF